MNNNTANNISNYNHQLNEKKWQKFWQENKIFAFNESDPKESGKEKFYVLEMFPYPSGKIHMGHLRNYSIGDAIARFKMLEGYNVLHPMGFDSFGLPAENAALEHKIHPKQWTLNNIDTMRSELQSIGLSIDWEREVITCLPEYYRHEQEIFLEFLKNGIAYQKESLVNWDPVDKTVLANEQVVEGRGWRSGALVEKRSLKQWFLKVSDFAEDLLVELPNLKGWDEKVLTMQEKWIGKSSGLVIDFKIEDSHNKLADSSKLTIYTTRPETLFGASFIAISPQHILAEQLAKTDQDIANFIAEANRSAVDEQTLEKQEKNGINTRLFAVNPVNQQLLPIFIANFVLIDYGTGAIFGCPAHDNRDFEFATKYHLPIKPVIIGYKQLLQSDEFINHNHQAIVDLVHKIKVKIESSKSESAKISEAEKELAFINACLNFVAKNIAHVMDFAEFSLEKPLLVASEVLANCCQANEYLPNAKAVNGAFCYGKSNLLAAMLRCNNIYCGFSDQLLLLDENDLSGKKIIHNLNAIYLPNQQKWLRIDARGQDVSREHCIDSRYINQIAYSADVSLGEIDNLGFYAKNHDEVVELYRQSKSNAEILSNLPAKTDSFLGGELLLEDGIMVNSGFLDAKNNYEAKKVINEYLINKNIAQLKTNYRLRDWGVSRQRYWGCPIPILYLEDGSIVAVPKEDLPVMLPEDVEFNGNGNPLANHPTWKYTTYKGQKAIRETDTFDTFFDSSWYFLRYISKTAEAPFDADLVNKYMPVDYYIGGVEHAVMHLLYARFFVKALEKCQYLNIKEPFAKLLTQGMVCHRTFKDKQGKWLMPTDVVEVEKNKFIHQHTKEDVVVGRSEKMSKSKKNVVEPINIIKSYGADTARLFMLSDTPPDRDLEWSESGIDASWRYINRLWKLVNSQDFVIHNLTINQDDVKSFYLWQAPQNGYLQYQQKLVKENHQLVSAIINEYRNSSFNRAIAKIHEFSNLIEKFVAQNVAESSKNNEEYRCNQNILYYSLQNLVLLISPLTPHLAEELWLALGNKTSVVLAKLPIYQESMLVETKINLTVQVNGKLRAVIEAEKDLPEAELIQIAKDHDNVKKFLQNMVIKKTIVVPNKIINFVV
jgi:leucyl-tRNA synthetase